MAPLAIKAAGVKAALAGEPLVALERRMNAAHAIVEDPDHPESVWDEYTSLQDQIAAMPAMTVAGLAVKLRLMRSMTPFLDCHEFGDIIIESTIESAERLAVEVRS